MNEKDEAAVVRDALEKNNTPRCPAKWRCREQVGGVKGYLTEAEVAEDVARHYGCWDEELVALDRLITQRDQALAEVARLRPALEELIEAVMLDYNPTVSRGKRTMEAAFDARQALATNTREDDSE